MAGANPARAPPRNTKGEPVTPDNSYAVRDDVQQFYAAAAIAARDDAESCFGIEP